MTATIGWPVLPEIDDEDEARKKFVAESAYLDDRPGAPLRFLEEVNLNQVVRREERNGDPEETRAQLNDRIRTIFEGNVLEAVCFPGRPPRRADEAGESRPKLVVVSYDAVAFEGTVDHVPDLIDRIYTHKGADGQALRLFRNNLVFVAADESRREEMRAKARLLLALRELKKPERLDDLAEHQQAKVRKLANRSEMELATSIQQCYRHVPYPSRNKVEDSSERPGAGQKQVTRVLQDLGKLRLSGDKPDSPAYVRDRTPLCKGQIDDPRPSRRVQARSDVADPRGRRCLRSRRADRCRERRVRLPKRRPALRSGGAVGDDSDRRAVGRADHGVREEHRRLARAEAGASKVDKKAADSDHEGVLPIKSAGDDLFAAEGEQAPGRFRAEGPFGEAMVRIWEQARGKGATKIATLDIRVFVADEGLRLLALVEGLPGVAKSVSLEGGYETTAGGSLDLDYCGPLDDAGPVREFLQSQFRATSKKTLEARCKLTFREGLATKGDAPEKLTERFGAVRERRGGRVGDGDAVDVEVAIRTILKRVGRDSLRGPLLRKVGCLLVFDRTEERIGDETVFRESP